MARAFLKRAILFSGAAAVCLSSHAAMAGFEWKGPLTPPVAQQAPAISDDLAPVIMWEGDSKDAPAMPAQKVEGVDQETVSSADGQTVPLFPEAQEPVPAAVAPATPAEEQAPPAAEVVSGFGADLPLVIALQQVVPAGYQFSFAREVSPGALVSWDGGKPWTDVLREMLAAQGMSYRLNGNVVAVSLGTAQPQSVAPVPAVPPAAPATSGQPSSKADLIPSDMVEPQMPASEAQPEQTMPEAAVPPAGEPVEFRRQKPSRLLGRMSAWGQDSSKGSEGDDVSASAGAITVGSAPPPDIEAPVADDVQKKTVVIAPTAMMDPKVESITKTAPSMTEGTQPAVTGTVHTPEKETTTTAVAEPKWAGAAGQTLRDVLTSWSEVAGVELYWSIDYDYRLSGDVSYMGSYDEAVAKLMDRYTDVRPQPYGQLHQGESGNRVLVIKSYDLIP